MEQTALFRKAALDRLSSPEQLDTLMRVTDAKGWLALVGCGVIIGTALVWSIIGSVQSKVSATGILMPSGGLVEVTAPGDGDLTALTVTAGSVVKKDQVIARIAQPALADKIETTKKRIEEVDDPTDARRVRMQGDLASLQQQFDANSRVVAGVDGRVVEVRAVAGDHLTQGRSLVAVERTNPTTGASNLEAMLYLDAETGQALRPGTPVELAPSVVSSDRHGVLIGKIAQVDMYPSTRLGMMAALHNEQLVDGFIQAAGGAPIAVRVELLADPKTPSGFRWSSGAGPNVVLTSGVRCTASVITRSHRPIGLVFPALDDGG